MSKTTVIITEQDGDRSCSCFAIELKDIGILEDFHWYFSTTIEKQKALTKARTRARKIAEQLDCYVEEQLYE